MNIMRKLLSQGSTAGDSPGQESGGPSSPTRSGSTSTGAGKELLGLSHLKRLLSDYHNPPHPLSESEKEEKLYAMLPLFCKTFASCPSGTVTEKFGSDCKPFTKAVSRLLVVEVRRRAGLQSTEEAANKIASFLEVNETSEETSNGWMLLSGLNILGAEANPEILDIMTTTAVPSTLVKCLYLFFDLTPVPEDAEKSDAEFTPKERRILLQKMCIQVMLHLCSHIPAVEELALKDDLTLLFSAVTSTCPKHNIVWRKTASDILLRISRTSLSQPVISYLHNKGCISNAVANMESSSKLSPLEIVEMFVTVFCFLKDSAHTSDTLLEDFRACQGYNFLSDFLLKLDNPCEGTEAAEATRNLVLLVASLAFCGYTELKMPNISSFSQLYQQTDFVMPQPLNKGSTVRNVHAVKVLQTVFLKAEADLLSETILDAMSTIYHADNANYFLLEAEYNTLTLFVEKVFKSQSVKAQCKFFQLVEFLVMHLKFVPCKELMSISRLLKAMPSQDCCVTAIQALVKILKFDPIFKDVYREVGMVEALTELLEHLSESCQPRDQDQEVTIASFNLIEVTLGALGDILAGCSANATVFRESDGTKIILQLAKIDSTRTSALDMLRPLVSSGGSGSEDDLTSLLEMLHSLPKTSVTVKLDILNALVNCLTESHRTRAAFRRVGGFVYLISVLVSLENSLSTPLQSEIWKDISQVQILSLIRSVFACLAASMRFEPANAKFFHVEMNCGDSLVETVKLLGCFSNQPRLANSTRRPPEDHQQSLRSMFRSDVSDVLKDDNAKDKALTMSTVILRILYDLAVDNFAKGHAQPFKEAASRTSSNAEGQVDGEQPTTKKPTPSQLNLTPIAPDPAIVHSGVVKTMLKLLPSLYFEDHAEMSTSLQMFALDVIKSLMRTERNQQIMCEVKCVAQILSMGKDILEDEAHVLHEPFQYMLERLASQKLEPYDLRTILRLGNPLACLTYEERQKTYSETPANQKPGSFIPLTRIKTLVSMTTPRDLHVQNNSILPPFIEMDMSPEGFGCIYLPSIAPYNPNASAGVTALASQDGNLVGGIGSIERSFPPHPGLTFATWICIDKFSDPRSDPHPVRLLTLTRQLKDQEVGTICFAVCLSARDKALVISTQETPQNKATDWQPEFIGDNGARIWFPDLITEGEWHHIVVSLNRQVAKSPTFSLFVNGQHIATQKMNYINIVPGGVSSGNGVLANNCSVHALIGTPPTWRRQSKLCWKQGPCVLFEDFANLQLASLLFKLGPHYLGSLQAPQVPDSGEVLTSQIHEDKIIFGLNAVAVSEMTLAKIRRVYSKFDNKAIAKQLGLSPSENATPIKVIHNSAGHLLGPARSMGGVIVGYLGVRIFTPQPVSKVIETVGGCDILLGIIAMARDMESLYAGVKALVCVLRSNQFARMEMEANKGYETLAMLLRKKTQFLNSHVLYLLFTMAGTIDPGKETSSIPNVSAFREILCDLELWHAAPDELEKSLFEHFYELCADTNMQRNGVRIRSLRDFNLVDRLLSILKKGECSDASTITLLNVIRCLLCSSPRVSDVLCFALFTSATLNSSLDSENELNLNEDGTEALDEGRGKDVVLRNRSLKVFFSLLYAGKKVHTKYCEDVIQVVGFDWVLLFLQGHLHRTTMTHGLRILTTLLSLPNLLEKFRLGNCNGHWLIKSEIVLQDKMVQALGQTSTSASRVTRQGIRQDIFDVPGFQLLNWLMPNHIEMAETYFLLFAIALGQPVKDMPSDPKLDLDSVWMYLFGGSTAEKTCSEVTAKVNVSGDAIVTVLKMTRAMLNKPGQDVETLPDWMRDYPLSIIQILCYLYHNMKDFIATFMTEEVLTAFVGTLIPYHREDQDDSLTNHPAKRNIMQFMKLIIVDSLSLQTSPKNPPVIDLLLDAKPEQSGHEQRCRFQTDLLALVMDHLVAADVLIGDQADLPIIQGGSSNYIPPNVFYVSSRLVDKMWTGHFKRDPDEVFQFILKLIAQAKQRSGSGTASLECIYRCLNRSILYLLSRPHGDVVSQISILEFLHQITTNRSIIFGAGNHEVEFFGCITFCLIQIHDGLRIPTDAESKTQWHVRPDGDADESLDMQQGHHLLANAASRVWEELYVKKRPAVEEGLKFSFNQNETPPLATLRSKVFDHSSKLWLSYVSSELKATYARIPAWEYQNQLESRIQVKLTGVLAGGLKRLTSVTGGTSSSSETRTRKEDTKVHYSALPKSVVLQATLDHIGVVRDVIDKHCKNREQAQSHMLKYVEEEWLQTEALLQMERSIWGPFREDKLTKWMLDMTEGPSRRRQRLIRNDFFYLHYRHRHGKSGQKGEDKPLKYKRPTSLDSKLWFEQHQNLAMFEREESRIFEFEYDDCDVTVQDKSLSIEEQMKRIGFQGIKQQFGQSSSALESATLDEDEDDTKASKPSESTNASSTPDEISSPSAEPTSPSSVAGQHHHSTATFEEDSSDYQTVMRLLEDGERITHMYRCARIQGLDTAEGLLLFGREHFYILDGFTLVNGKEVHDIDFIPANRFEPLIPVVPGQVSRLKGKRQVNKFSYDNIKEVHKRRYLLQPIAVEIFSTNGQNYLLAFNKAIRAKVYQRLLTVSPQSFDSAQDSVAGQKRNANVEQSSGIFSSLMETSVTQRWVRGEINNFQYLMALNTLAGRSYNDLMQYPIFPWILADYKSEELDLTNPESFRDLSKPMGAQTEVRMQQFLRRYQEWDDPHNDTPPYHYGTHYSSAMIVSSYLIRLEPFTQHFLHLQGGFFDLADRMFHSVEEAWDSASRNNMADLRELIPEFFYLPDFLENSNKFDLGMKQNGERLDDVMLPPWAKNSPAEFIRVHREALESDYVSAHLHEWIDLIFGCKQQGPEAVQAVNVFHHLFYEGNVDIFSIEDPLQRNATIGFINNFGQIPYQLFKKPHPAKKVLKNGSETPSSNTLNSKVFFHNLTNLRPSMAPVKELKGPVGQIQENNRSISAVEQNKVLVPGNANRYLSWGYADQSFRLCNYDTDKTVFICEPNYLIGEVMTCVCLNATVVLTAGTSTVVAVYEYHKKLKQLLIKKMLYGHTDAVTCLAASPGWNIAVSGSRDRTAIIWDLSRYCYVKHMAGHAGPIAAVSINELTGDIVTCAGSWLYLYSINGKPLASINTALVSPAPKNIQQQVLCICTSQFNEWDRENVIMTGSSDGVVRMWSVDFVEEAESEAKRKTSTPKSVSPTSNPNSLISMAKKMEDMTHLKTILTKNDDDDEQGDSSDTEDDQEDKDKPKEGSSTPEKEQEEEMVPTNNEDFVVISQADVEGGAGSEPRKGDGYTWTRKLVFRAKLTMHTAFEREDNVDPAAVTALAVSKDHRTIYVGDEKGRVFTWSVSSRPGKGMVDHWCKDEGSEECLGCGVKFTIYERRHHCRACGKLFCSSCSQYQSEIPSMKILQKVRVCKNCFDRLQTPEVGEAKA